MSKFEFLTTGTILSKPERLGYAQSGDGGERVIHEPYIDDTQRVQDAINQTRLETQSIEAQRVWLEMTGEDLRRQNDSRTALRYAQQRLEDERNYRRENVFRNRLGIGESNSMGRE